jgi:hypothetical protein
MSLEISLISKLNFKLIFKDNFCGCINDFIQVCKTSSILALRTSVTDRCCVLHCELAAGDELVVRLLASTPKNT